MLAQVPSQEPTDYYWAAEPDPDELVNYLVSRRDHFFYYLYGSRHYERIARNWRYYHGLYYDGLSDLHGMELRPTGEEGENVAFGINIFRSHLHMMLTYTCQNRPAWDTKAINSDHASMQQAKLGNDILDYYMDQRGVESYLRRAVEDSLIFGSGYLKVSWDDSQGDDVVADPNTQQIYKSGDIAFDNPSIFDVIYDHLCRRFEDSRWVLIRNFANKWELIEKYPQYREEILQTSPVDKYDWRDYRRAQFQRIGAIAPNSDSIDLWEFYHERTTALPDGRYALFVGTTPLEEGPMPYSKKPLLRVVPAPLLLTTFGYTPAFDLQGVQEAINSELSTIILNHKNLGPTKIWFHSDETINIADLEPGTTVLQSDTKPEPINFAQTPREFFSFMDQLAKYAEYVSGVNAVAHGQPQESLRSAAALALIDQKALQYASILVANYYRFLCDAGTFMLELLKQNANSPRVIYIAGVNNRSALKEFQAQDLKNISRVSVVSGNPMSKTTVGRQNIATDLIQNGLLKTPEEYLTVLQTGQIRPAIEANDAQLTTCHAENEALRNGTPVAALITDNHVFHVLKHQSILDSPETRLDQMLSARVLGHIKEHIAFLIDPECQWYMRVLGYPIPLPPMVTDQMPTGQEGEGNPAGQPGQDNNPAQQGQKPPAAGLGGEEAQNTLESAAMEVGG